MSVVNVSEGAVNVFDIYIQAQQLGFQKREQCFEGGQKKNLAGRKSKNQFTNIRNVQWTVRLSILAAAFLLISNDLSV